MLDGDAVVRSLEESRRGGASRDDLLRQAVREVERSEDHFDWVGIYLLEEAGGGPGGRDHAEESGSGTEALEREGPEREGASRGDVLVLHNYIGRPTEHDRIPVGTGVCGEAVAAGRDINVPDVKERENYLACSPETRSELVVLIRDEDDGIRGQIDLDSDRRAAFTDRDRRELRTVADWLGGLF